MSSLSPSFLSHLLNSPPLLSSFHHEFLAKRFQSTRCPTDYAILIYSGSFNPVHHNHIEYLIQCRQYLESKGLSLLCAFVCPSPPSHIQQKVDRQAEQTFVLTSCERLHLIELHVKERGIEWIMPLASADAHDSAVWPHWNYELISSEVHRQLGKKAGALGRKIHYFDLYGADNVLEYELYRLDRNILCVAWDSQRGGPEEIRAATDKSKGSLQEEAIKSKRSLTAGKTDFGFHLIDAMGSSPTIDSTSIRQMVAKQEWKSIKENKWIAESVFNWLVDKFQTDL
jgi:hypothetical protein